MASLAADAAKGKLLGEAIGQRDEALAQRDRNLEALTRARLDAAVLGTAFDTQTKLLEQANLTIADLEERNAYSQTDMLKAFGAGAGALVVVVAGVLVYGWASGK